MPNAPPQVSQAREGHILPHSMPGEEVWEALATWVEMPKVLAMEVAIPKVFGEECQWLLPKPTRQEE